MIFKIHYKKITSFLLIIFSGFYLTRILPFSPIYLSFTIALLIFILGQIHNFNKIIHRLSILPSIYILYLVVTQPINNPNLSSLINVLFSFVYLIFILNSIKDMTKEEIVKYSKYFILFSILILSIEAFWRLTHPVFLIEGTDKDYRQLDGLLFYAYKYSSIMFLDSNFVGTYCVVSYFYYLYLLHEKLVHSKIPILLLGVLIVFTLSRSAILTLPITHLILYITQNKGFRIVRFVFIICIFIGTLLLFSKLQTDLSFQSKFELVELAITYFKHASFFNLFFGIGFGNTVEYLGIGSHNLFLTYIIESGFFGFLFFIVINMSFIKGSNMKSLYITIPLFISGMSLSGHAISYYYSCLAIIYILNKKNGINLSIDTNL